MISTSFSFLWWIGYLIKTLMSLYLSVWFTLHKQTVRHQWRNMHTFQPLLLRCTLPPSLRCTLPPSLRCTLPPSRSTSKAHVAAITHLKGWLWVLHEDLLYSFGGGSLCELGSQVLTAVVALECHILPWTAQGRAHYHELYQMTVYQM